MKYLIVSDIHGSLPALEQVLAFYREQQCGMLCILGDILNYGPRNGIPQGLDPKGIAERLNAMAGEIVAIRGNCDSEVDQMLLDFPILSDYTLLVDNGKRFFLTHVLFCADPWVFQKPRWAITRVCAEVLAIINIIANKHITFFILSFPLIVSYIRADSLVSRILH